MTPGAFWKPRENGHPGYPICALVATCRSNDATSVGGIRPGIAEPVGKLPEIGENCAIGVWSVRPLQKTSRLQAGESRCAGRRLEIRNSVHAASANTSDCGQRFAITPGNFRKYTASCAQRYDRTGV
jgi:hypothetical protein